jgi:hypothetical protein
MTSQELRIAKLSKTLNNAGLRELPSSKTFDLAYKQTLTSLERSLNEERSRIQQDFLSYNLGINSQMTEENLKKQALRHHSLVLEAQIKENQLKKRIKAESTEPNYSSPLPPPSQSNQAKNLKLRDELLRQMQEKEAKKRQEAENDKQTGQKMIDDSQKLLQQEYLERTQARQKAFNALVDSWEETIKVNSMKKKLEKIRTFGPKVEVFQPIPENLPSNPQTPVFFKSFEKKPLKKPEKTLDWKQGLRSTSVKSSSSKAAGKSFNSIIEKFSTLNSREKIIQKDKEDLINSLKTKKNHLKISNYLKKSVFPSL